MRIFVAGGAGMAGTAIVDAVLKVHGDRTVRASFRETPPAIDDPRVEHVHLDLADRDELVAVLKGCDVAILAAAESGGIHMLSEHPWHQVGPNLRLATAWFEALQEAGVRRTIWIGSATCYQPFNGAIREDQLDWNQDPSPETFGVGWVMRMAEKLCEFWSRSAGMDVVRVRSANIYGPRARFDPRRSNFIPALIRKVADRMNPLEVWGAPDVTRDVIYSADFGEAIARLLDAPTAAGKVYNLGSGRGVRVGDVVKTLLRVTDNEDVEVDYTAAGRSSAGSRILNCERVYTELGWAPRTTLEDGLRETMRWWLANRGTWQR